MSAFDDVLLPASRFYKECLLDLIKSDPRFIDEMKGILAVEFNGSPVWNLSEADLKRFNGRAMTVLRFHGVLDASGHRIAA